MNASPVQIIYELHVARIDIELRDTRRREHRTATGRIRPYFTFVFFQKASLVMAYSLSADEPDQQMLAALLIGYHQRVNDKTGLSPLTFWETHCFPCPVDPHRLASLLGDGIHRTITHRGIYYHHRLYWHEDLAALLTPGTEVHVYPTPSLARPMTIEVFHQGQWICSALMSRD